MKRYILPVIFSLAVVALYRFVPLRLFSLDLTQRTRESLFFLRDQPEMDLNIALFNVGELQGTALEDKIDSLLLNQPRKVGINLCHFDQQPEAMIQKYKSDKRVVFANCAESGTRTLAQVVEKHNVVKYFKTDKADYFEIELAEGKPRGNKIEMIHFGSPHEFGSAVAELNETLYWFNPEYLAGKTLLVGYIGDYLGDDIDHINSCRTTPLNYNYGHGTVPPDMFDIEISAHIIRTLNSGDYINVVNSIVRVLVLIAITMFAVIILSFVKTRMIMVNLVIATVTFILLIAGAALLIVFAFQERLYLNLDEIATGAVGHYDLNRSLKHDGSTKGRGSDACWEQ